MEIQIRPAVVEDCSGITTMTNLLGYPSSEAKVCQILQMVIEHSDHEIYVAQSDNQIVGYVHLVCTMRMGSDPFVEIAALFVHEAFQGQGVGSALLKKTVQWTKEKGYQVIRIRSNIIRKRARKFFITNGFENIKTQDVFVKIL